MIESAVALALNPATQVKSMRNHVLVDIDHCLSNAFHRDHLLPTDGDWDFYHSASINDQPIHDMVELISALSLYGLNIIGISSRPEKWRALTQRWLHENNIQLDELLLRPDNNYQPAADLKHSLAVTRFAPSTELRDHILIVIDDREDVLERFSIAGITTLQVTARS